MADKASETKVLSPRQLEAKTRQKWMIIGALVVATIVALAVASTSGRKSLIPQKREEFLDVTPGAVKDTRNMALQQEVSDLRTGQQELQKTIASQGQQLSTFLDEMKRLRSADAEFKQGQRTIDARFERMANESDDQFKKRIDEYFKEHGGTSSGAVPPPPEAGKPYKMPTFKIPGATVKSTDGEKVVAELQKAAEPTGAKPVVFEAPKVQSDSGTKSDVKMKENPYAGWVPTGTFAKIALLTGVDAGTSDFDINNPQPILMRVQADGIGPGDGSYKLENCFALGTGFGRLDAERVYIKVERLSCEDRKKGLILDAEIDGQVVDSDSTQGLRGKVIRRSGQLLAKAMIAGFASGIAEVAQAQSVTQTTSGLTGAVTQSIKPDEIARAGAWSGAGKAAELLAEQYIKEARNIFPVISVPSGRKGSFYLTLGKQLKWEIHHSKYIPDVKPAGVRK